MTLYHSKKKKGGTPGGWMSSFIDDLFNAQQGLCFHCAQPMTRRQDQERGWTREHVFPRARSGYLLLNNVVLAHPHCNQEKDDREPTKMEIDRAAMIYSILNLIPFDDREKKKVIAYRINKATRRALQEANRLHKMQQDMNLQGGENG